MTRQEATGKWGLLLAAMIAAAMSASAFFAGSPQPLTGAPGICLPSVNVWGLTPLASWIINLLLMFGCAGMLAILNKTYNFVPGNDTLLPAAFLVAVSSIPWVSGILTSSIILALANLICMSVMFGSYRSGNATQPVFLIATILSFGSMIQYAFVFMIPVYIVTGLLLKCFRLKELIALVMGLVAPYWMGVGLGIISPDAFSMPSFANLFDNFHSRGGLFFGIVNIATVVLVSFILSLQNIVTLYAGNSRRRLFTMAFNVLGIMCAVCMMVDFNNLTAYIATTFTVAAVALADFFALRYLPRPRLWLLIPLLFFITLFILTLRN